MRISIPYVKVFKHNSDMDKIFSIISLLSKPPLTVYQPLPIFAPEARELMSNATFVNIQTLLNL